MERLILDSSVISKLGALERPAELYDQSGKFLAYLMPASVQGLECPLSESEIERRSQETEEYTTAEVLAYLETL